MKLGIRRIVTVIFAAGILIVQSSALAATSPELGQVTTHGSAAINGQPAIVGASIFSGDRIITQRDSTAALSLIGGREIILVGPGSLMVTSAPDRIAVAIDAGNAAVLSPPGSPVEIYASGIRIVPGKAGGVYVIQLEGQTLSVTARKGIADVYAANRTVEVSEGMRCEATLGPPQRAEEMGAPALRTPIVKYMIVAAFMLSVAALTLAVIDLNASCRVSPSSVGSCEVVH